MTFPDDESSPVYALRVKEQARRDVDALLLAWEKARGTADALRLSEAFVNEFAGLTHFPRRCARVPEAFRQEVRAQMLRFGGQVWRILFTLTNEAADALEPPTVRVLTVRNAVQKPLTRRQARALEIEGAS